MSGHDKMSCASQNITVNIKEMNWSVSRQDKLNLDVSHHMEVEACTAMTKPL